MKTYLEFLEDLANYAPGVIFEVEDHSERYLKDIGFMCCYEAHAESEDISVFYGHYDNQLQYKVTRSTYYGDETLPQQI